MQAATGVNADFTGVFVKWDYQPGQKYIQLLFKTATGMRLSLSRSRHLARSLTVGRMYRIKGIQYSIGNKTYVHEPTAIPLETPASHRKRNRITFVCILLIVSAAAGLFVVISHQRSQTNSIDTKNAAIGSKSPASATLSSKKKAVSPTENTISSSEPAATTTTPTTSSTSKITPKQTTASAPATSTSPVSASVSTPAQDAAPAQTADTSTTDTSQQTTDTSNTDQSTTDTSTDTTLTGGGTVPDPVQ